MLRQDMSEAINDASDFSTVEYLFSCFKAAMYSSTASNPAQKHGVVPRFSP
jgi:hypothetical protein